MDKYIILENYIQNYNEIKYLEKNASILLNTCNNNNILLTLYLTKHNIKNYINIQKKYNGIFKKCYIKNKNREYNYILILYNNYILQYLCNIYENNISLITENILYNDYALLYANIINYINVDEIFI